MGRLIKFIHLEDYCLVEDVFVNVFILLTDGHPVMAAGSPCGHIGLWDLEDKKLINQMRNAHSTAIAGLTFLHREPLLVTNGADNALRVLLLSSSKHSDSGYYTFVSLHQP